MAKYLPLGTTVSINSVLIGGLISVSTPGRVKGSAEVTDSDSGYDREYIPGLREGGEVTLTFRHDPEDPGQEELDDNYQTDGNAAIVPIIINLPADSIASAGIERIYSFDGFVMSAPSGDLGLVDDTAAEQSATIKVATGVTLSSG